MKRLLVLGILGWIFYKLIEYEKEGQSAPTKPSAPPPPPPAEEKPVTEKENILSQVKQIYEEYYNKVKEYYEQIKQQLTTIEEAKVSGQEAIETPLPSPKEEGGAEVPPPAPPPPVQRDHILDFYPLNTGISWVYEPVSGYPNVFSLENVRQCNVQVGNSGSIAVIQRFAYTNPQAIQNFDIPFQDALIVFVPGKGIFDLSDTWASEKPEFKSVFDPWMKMFNEYLRVGDEVWTRNIYYAPNSYHCGIKAEGARWGPVRDTVWRVVGRLDYVDVPYGRVKDVYRIQHIEYFKKGDTYEHDILLAKNIGVVQWNIKKNGTPIIGGVLKKIERW